MADCTECQWYEPVDNKTVMFCKKTKSYFSNTEIHPCSCFTPKPIEPPWAAEKVKERVCYNCEYAGESVTGKHCYPCDDHSGYVAKKPAEKPDWADSFKQTIMQGNLCGVNKMNQPPKKAKENKMKIFKFSVRRYVMACTLYVTAKIAIWLNPWLFRLLVLVGIDRYNDTISIDSTSPKQILAAWCIVALAIGVICAAIYTFNKVTTWVFSRMEK